MYFKGKHHNSIYVSIFHKESLKSRSGLLTTFVLDPRDILVSSLSRTLQMGRRAWLLPIWYLAPCTWHLVPRAWHLDSPEKTPDLKTQTLVDSCEPRFLVWVLLLQTAAVVKFGRAWCIVSCTWICWCTFRRQLWRKRLKIKETFARKIKDAEAWIFVLSLMPRQY